MLKAHRFLPFCKMGVSFAIIVTAGLLSGCAEMSLLGHAAGEMKGASAPGNGTVNRGDRKVGKPYQIDNIWYYPADDPNYNETGLASWYGEPFHGRRTANGAIYDMNQLTAAHKTLPMPTDVRVTNLENGRSIVVTVNDRGPFVHGRIIDLSRRAAQLLGVIRNGTAKVRVELANPGQEGDVRYLAKAETTPEEKKKVIAAPNGKVQTATLAPPENVKSAPKSNTAPLPKPVKTAPISAKTQPQKPVVTVKPVSDSEIFIQAGAFIDYNNANRLSAKLSSFGPTKINQVLVNGQDFYRVRVGPVYSVSDADTLLSQLINSGHTNARIIIE